MWRLFGQPVLPEHADAARRLTADVADFLGAARSLLAGNGASATLTLSLPTQRDPAGVDRLAEVVVAPDGSTVTSDGPAQVVAARPGIILMGYRPDGDADRDTTWLLDLPRSRALRLEVRSVVRQGARIAECTRTDYSLTASATPFEPGDIAGQRVVWDYGDQHVYEHIYLTSRSVVWHDTVAGAADLEDYQVTLVADELYLLHWSERRLARTVAMLIDLSAGRLFGYVFGWQPDTGDNLHAAVDASARVIERLTYPDVGAAPTTWVPTGGDSR